MPEIKKDTGKKIWNFGWLILVCTIINIFLVLFVAGMKDKPLNGDEVAYDPLAINLIDNQSFSMEMDPPHNPTILRSPGYPIFLAFLYVISGKSILFAKIFQLLLLGFSSYLLYSLAKFYTDETISRLTALLFLFYFPFLFLSAMIMSELLATFLIISFALLVKKYDWMSSGKKTIDILIGLNLGVMAIVRPTMTLFVIPIFIILWLIYIFKRSSLSFNKLFVKSLIVGFSFLFVLSPWMIRNAVITHRFIPLTVRSSAESQFVSLLQYNGKISYAFTLEEYYQFYSVDLVRRIAEAEDKINKGEAADIAELPKTVQTEMLVEQSYKISVKEEMKELTVLRVIKSIPVRIAYLWSTSDFAPLNIFNGNIHRIGQAQYLIFLLFGIIGVVASWRKILNFWLLYIFAIYLTVIHIIFHEEPRYTVPARSLILIFTAIGFVWVWNKLKNLLTSRTLGNAN